MWVRKSTHKITRERGHLWLSFRGPVLWFLIMFAGAIVLTAQGPRTAVAHWPSTWFEVISRATVFAAVVAIGVYVLQIILNSKLDPFAVKVDVVMCDTCHRVKRRDGEASCECGGKFNDFDNWMWVDQPEK